MCIGIGNEIHGVDISRKRMRILFCARRNVHFINIFVEELVFSGFNCYLPLPFHPSLSLHLPISPSPHHFICSILVDSLVMYWQLVPAIIPPPSPPLNIIHSPEILCSAPGSIRFVLMRKGYLMLILDAVRFIL